MVRLQEYGRQHYAADVVDFADPRVSALLKGSRDDEIIQVLHRARLVALEPQAPLPDFAPNSDQRHRVRLVLHTSHPIPGLRVDELIAATGEDVNERRSREAELRIRDAMETLQSRGEPITVTAVAKVAGAHKATVAKTLGKAVHTPKKDLLN